jgi:hypothetical protein
VNNNKGTFLFSLSLAITLKASFEAKFRNGLKFIKKNKSLNFLQRSDSEFSIGLGRSASIQRELSEFGPLCHTGQIIQTFINHFLIIGFPSLLLIFIFEDFITKFKFNLKK